jgi:hypothetical protein
MITYAEAKAKITRMLELTGSALETGALKPLQSIDFAELISIHDHEEYFLEQTFFEILMRVHGIRASAPSENVKVTERDVETALRELGVAAVRQPPQKLSENAKDRIKDACGFC